MSNQNNKNRLISEAGLKIPVIDLSLAESGKYLSEPETINDSLLELLSEENDLSSLVIVKLDRDRGQQLQYEDPALAEQICHNVTCSLNVTLADGSFAPHCCDQTSHPAANIRGKCFPPLYLVKPTACLGSVTVHGRDSPLVLSLFLEPLGRPRLPLGRAEDSGGAAFALATG